MADSATSLVHALRDEDSDSDMHYIRYRFHDARLTDDVEMNADTDSEICTSFEQQSSPELHSTPATRNRSETSSGFEMCGDDESQQRSPQPLLVPPSSYPEPAPIPVREIPACTHTEKLCKTCGNLHEELKALFLGHEWLSTRYGVSKPPGETSNRSRERIRSSSLDLKSDDLSLGLVRDVRKSQICSNCCQQVKECQSCQELSEILGLENREISDSAYIRLRRVRDSQQWDASTFIVESDRQLAEHTRRLRSKGSGYLEDMLQIYVDSPVLRSAELLFAPGSGAYNTGADFGFPAIRSIDPNVLDINFAKACFRRCLSSHESTCSNVDVLISTSKPNIYLLDLKRQCLVKATVDHEYVALSYVWGQSTSDFGCRKANLKRFLEHGSLDDPDFFLIPPLVSSAMDFTRQMGQRFLWIDRYCIVQDDGRHKHEQVMAMGTIYANACFTMVSADGDASIGIAGIGTSASHATRRRNTFKSVGDVEILYGMRYKAIPTNTSWASRGWTFQEQMFSRRLVIFFQGQLIWKCKKSLCQEAFSNEVVFEAREQRSSVDSLQSPGWPDCDLFRRLVENYSKRTLSFPCDSISAFSGVLTTLRNSFPGGFLFGLPESYFDVALLWQPGVPVRDRYHLAKAVGKPVEPLPSWSWCRWQGKLNFGNWLAGNDCLLLSSYSQNICSISPIVTWSKFDTTSGARTGICNSYANFRDNTHRSTLPKDWEKDEGLQHKTINHDYRFRFPVPLATTMDSNDTTMPEQWNTTIVGTVKRAFVVLGEEIPLIPRHEAMLGICSWRYLQNQGGQIIGVVCSNSVHSSKRHLHTQEIFEPSSWSYDAEEAEMIAISKGEFHIALGAQPIGYPEGLFQPWELAQRQKDHVYAFYNVMWIERVDGVAVRRALGRVLQRAWDSLKAETIEIVLG